MVLRVQSCYIATLWLHVIFTFMPHIAARCCNKEQQETPRESQLTSPLIPCVHGILNVKHHRTTPKPSTRITVEDEAALARK